MLETIKIFKGSQPSWKYPITVGNVCVNVGVGVGVGVNEVHPLPIHSSLIWIFTPTSADGNLPQ